MPGVFNIAVCSNNDSSIRKVTDFLAEKNYKLFHIEKEEELISLINRNEIQLILLELDFKTKDGISITSDLRNLKEIEQPYILIFSNKQDDYIQITAFNTGADDFINTPIKPLLLEAKIAILKKRYLLKVKNQKLSSDLKFHVDREQYLIITENKRISLPRKEFEMVNLMYQNAQKIFTRQDFAKLIWNAPEVANSRTIDIHIRNIRRILGNDIIKTSKGIGYMINAERI